MRLFRRPIAGTASSSGAVWLEMGSILVAIALGFFVSEWRDHRAERRLAGDALAAIRQELRLNLSSLRERQPYYAELTAQALAVAGRRGGEDFDADSLAGWRGVQPPLLSDAAWRAAQGTGALALIGFENARRAALAYGALERVGDTAERSLQGALLGELRSFDDVARVFVFLKEAAGIGVQTLEQVLPALPPGAERD